MIVMGTAALVLGLLALGVALYLLLLVRKAKDDIASAKADIQTIAEHIEHEVHPAVEWLTERQAALSDELIGVEGDGCTEEELAHAMLFTGGLTLSSDDGDLHILVGGEEEQKQDDTEQQPKQLPRIEEVEDEEQQDE